MMVQIRTVILIALGALAVGVATPALAAKSGDDTAEISAQRRARLTVYPAARYPGPNATRHCESWLARENRPSGPVLTPQMRCYWR
jgi:hypothetical protein